MKFTLKISIGLILLALTFFCEPLVQESAAESGLSKSIPLIALSDKEITNGSLLLLQINTQKLSPPVSNTRIRFQNRIYPLFPHPFNPAYDLYGLVSIPYRTAPGSTKLELRWRNAAGDQSRKIPFRIVAGKYKTDILKVDPSRVTPNKKNLQRAQKEARKLKRIYAGGSFAKFWEGGFQLPMASDITSPFGNKRLFNGQLKSYHNGVDFRAPIGTPVAAVNSGVVKLAENLFYSGNVVVIDHGTKVFSIYAHLSKIQVATGQQIEKGRQIGLTGATGRVSGPHLHWGMKVNGVAVDPLQFVDVIASLAGER